MADVTDPHVLRTSSRKYYPTRVAGTECGNTLGIDPTATFADAVNGYVLKMHRDLVASSWQKTPLSLLDRVQRGDCQAWAEFSGRCLDMLGKWCLRWGLQQADADDLIQDTLLIVVTRIRDFQHRGAGSFRSWIRTVAWRCWCDAVARASRNSRPEVLERITRSPEARQTLEEEFEKLFQLQLLEQAMAVVQQKVKKSSWEAFRMTALEGNSAETVSRHTGLNLNAIYAARMRVQRLVTDELKRLAGRS